MVDPYSEGYIGVTNLTIHERFDQHSKNVYKKSIVKKAIDKYNDVEIIKLHEASEAECLLLESIYRPHDLIGWNIAPGGGIPPRASVETAKKISETLKRQGISPYSEKTHSAEAIEKRRQQMKGRRWYYNPITGDTKLLVNCPEGWKEGRKFKNINKPSVRGVDYICNVSSWRIISPNGIEYNVYNLKEWCRQMSFPYLGPHRGKGWRGWSIEKISSTNIL